MNLEVINIKEGKKMSGELLELKNIKKNFGEILHDRYTPS